MTPEEFAEKIYTDFYIILLNSDSDLSEEIVISVLAKKCALKCLEKIIENNSTFCESIEIKHRKEFLRQTKTFLT